MNKKLMVGIVVAAVAVGTVFMFARSDNRPAEPEVTFSAVQQDVEQGARFYDVRTPQEYAVGRFAGAENWSLQDMQAGKLPDVPKDTKLYVHCQSGNRSAQATKLLRQAGFTNVTDLGGLSDVTAMGGTLIR